MKLEIFFHPEKIPILKKQINWHFLDFDNDNNWRYSVFSKSCEFPV